MVQWFSWLQCFTGPALQWSLCSRGVRGRSNSLAPVAQVVLWFPAPVVNGRGNSLVLWLHGVPLFPVAHWFLCSDCGAVQWLKCAVCGPVTPWIFQPPPSVHDAWNGSRQCTGFFCCAYFVQNGQVDPTPSWCSKPTQFLECRGTTNPVDQVQWYRTPHQLPEA